MLRTITLAAAAALLATAASAQSVTIDPQGKTAEQIQAAVHGAAVKLCRQETEGATFPINARAQCVADTMRQTYAKYPGLGADPQPPHGQDDWGRPY
jgi:hypothetical protein